MFVRPQRRRASRRISRTSGPCRTRRPFSPAPTSCAACIPAVTAAAGVVRSVRGFRRRPGGLAFFRRRLEQHHLHRRRSEKSAARRAAFARAGHGHRHLALFPGERRVSGRPCRWRRFKPRPDDRVATAVLQRHFRRRRREADGRRHHDLHLWLREWADPGGRARLLRHGPRRPVLSLHRPPERQARSRRKAWCCRASGPSAGAGAHAPGRSLQPAR